MPTEAYAFRLCKRGFGGCIIYPCTCRFACQRVSSLLKLASTAVDRKRRDLDFPTPVYCATTADTCVVKYGYEVPSFRPEGQFVKVVRVFVGGYASQFQCVFHEDKENRSVKL